jgi:hypothetical protein
MLKHLKKIPSVFGAHLIHNNNNASSKQGAPCAYTFETSCMS